MTIFHFALDSSCLGQLPSIRHVLGICLHLSRIILCHFRDMLGNRPWMQHEMDSVIQLVNERFDFFKRLIREESTNGNVMEIIQIYIDKKMDTPTPTFVREFDAETLASVPPKLLLEFMADLIDESLRSLSSLAAMTSSPDWNYNVSKLKSVPDRASVLIGVESSRRPNYLYTEMKVKVLDRCYKRVRYFIIDTDDDAWMPPSNEGNTRYK